MTSQLADVAVIGLGSAGEALSEELAGRGCHVAGFEPGLVGGECPFTACMPSKSLRHDAVSGATWDEARTHRDEVVEHLDDGSHAEALGRAGVNVVRSGAKIVDEGTVEADGRRWRARHVVLATGSSPVVPPIPVMDQVPWSTSDELMVAPELPESLLVLGGGAIGCEAATIMAGFGKQVTIVENGSLLGGGVDPAVAERVAVQLRAAGVQVCTDVELTEATPSGDGVRATLSDGGSVETAAMLIAAGQSPNWADLGLEDVDVGDAPDVDDEYRVGGRDWLRAIGDLNGRSPWTHGANHEARRLARLLVGVPAGPTADHMAHCIFTSPPVGAVGIVAALLHCGSTVQSAADMVLPFPTIAQVLTPAFRDAVDAMD